MAEDKVSTLLSDVSVEGDIVEKDKIIKHIDRKNYLTISYPVIATKKDLFRHLISNNFSWNLDLFIKNNNFKIINF